MPFLSLAYLIRGGSRRELGDSDDGSSKGHVVGGLLGGLCLLLTFDHGRRADLAKAVVSVKATGCQLNQNRNSFLFFLLLRVACNDL